MKGDMAEDSAKIDRVWLQILLSHMLQNQGSGLEIMRIGLMYAISL
jgi:hypothetical protein